VAGLVLTAVLYVWALKRFPARRRQPLFFAAGLAALVAALLSPIHTGAGYLFTLHMFQHMLLMLVAPPLLALALPPGMLGWVYRHRTLRAAYRTVWSPVTASVLYNGVLLVWHLPAAYDATLRSPLVHAVEHASFVAAGLVFWGVLAAPSPQQASVGVRLVMVVGADVVNFALGSFFTFAEHPLYLPYTFVPRLWGLSPVDDLRLGGVLMWVVGQMMYAVPVLLLLYWLLWREERRPARPVRPVHRGIPTR
jgi:cytochrome c oxidase assembly factor CtaG